MPPASDRKGKGKSSVADASQDGVPTERSPLLGRSSSSLAVRHGRGLLSDDEDECAPISVRSSSRRGNGHRSSKSNVTTTQNNEYDADDDRGAYPRDNDDDTDSLDDLLGPEEAGRRRQQRLVRNRGRHNTQAILCYTSLIVLAVIFLIFSIIHIWLGRFVSEQFSQDGKLLQQRAEHALIMKGPDRVQVYNVTGDKVTVQIDMRMGIDVRAVFGWNGTDASEKGIGSVRRWERHLVGWMSRRIGQTSVDLTQPALLSPADQPFSHMAQFGLTGPMVLPLHFPYLRNYSVNDTAWLRPVQLTVPIEVLESSVLANFVNQTINDKFGRVHVTVQRANVGLGRQEDRTWLTQQVRRYGATSVSDLQKDIDFQVPDSPDIPTDPSALVQLKSYQLITIPDVGIPPLPDHSTMSESLGIHATARITNPAFHQLQKLGLDLQIPFTWPYKIYLPVKNSKKHRQNSSTDGDMDRVLLARGVVEPFSVPSSSKHFEVSINGTVEKVHNTSDLLSRSLSNFVTRFLSGKNNTVVVAFDPESPFVADLPQFLIPLISPLSVENTVPGLPADERELLKDLQIQDMKVHGAEDGSGGFQIDGLMEGQVVFPDGLDKLDNGINITAVWPDILLYDDLPPADDGGQMPPRPLPLNAFARFRTKGYTPAETVKLADNTTVMRAHVKNVPFEILRQNVLQRWLAKIVFSGGKGVRTGIKGISQAQATLRGFGEIELHKLPVLGTFYAQNPYAKSLME